MKIFLNVLLLITSSALFAQVIKQPLEAIGQDGKYVQLNGGDSKGVVIFFTATRCPYDDHYLERMKKYASRYAGKILFYFVNAASEDTPEDIRKKLNSWGNEIPYLHDPDQNVLRALNAKRTSEVFFLLRTEQGLTLVYRGPLDDNPQVPEDADKNYLLDVIEATLNGVQPEAVTARPAGCFIRLKY
ncbi:MAG: redoxin domain-containing protein [Cyclobacteriaceae bacterium]